ncbi:MAG: hypothetical protein FWC96_10250 [Oscillospiraceae bacterium]|nr:hypothetical protein [Oscillospiraceae bacterium]
MLKWSFGKKKGHPWPKDVDGKPVPPAFLVHIHGGPITLELTLNLLDAYGMPYICQYPNNGLFGKLIMGHPPAGMEVFVPETLLVEAQNLLSADICEDDEEIEEA